MFDTKLIAYKLPIIGAKLIKYFSATITIAFCYYCCFDPCAEIFIFELLQKGLETAAKKGFQAFKWKIRDESSFV